jgi:GWxTD domain-containing protein
LLTCAAGPSYQARPAQRQKGLKKEPVDYYAKWLNEVVVYLVSEEEKAVFNKLQRDEEKEKFIEQFWMRRNSNPGSSQNEFKEEHYRRLSYANEHFAYAGRPGWATDRGMIYIKYGPPTESERFAPGNYNRELKEGGGSTIVFPFERWWYRSIVGIGDNVELEFVDPSMTGEFRLASDADEKDALLLTSPLGRTIAEDEGRLTRAERIIHRDDPQSANNVVAPTLNEMPFEKLYMRGALEAPPKIVHPEMRNIVKTRVTYHDLPFRYVTASFYIDGLTQLVPLTIAVANQDLQFEKVGDGFRARVDVYGRVENLSGQTIGEFDDTVSTELASNGPDVSKDSYYQRMLFLPPGRHKISLVLKDEASGKVGSVEFAITVPQLEKGTLALSSLILSRSITGLEKVPERTGQFVMGDLKIVPTVSGQFLREDKLGIYFQVYGATIDQASKKPNLSITYEITKAGAPFFAFEDANGNSVRSFSAQRAEVTRQFSLGKFSPGKYTLKLTVTDIIGKQSMVAKADLEVM